MKRTDFFVCVKRLHALMSFRRNLPQRRDHRPIGNCAQCWGRFFQDDKNSTPIYTNKKYRRIGLLFVPALLALVELFFQTTIMAQEKNTNTKPVWADLNVIDIHGHIGSFLGYDLRTETLMDNINRFGIRLVLISNIDGAHLPGKTLDLDEVTANRITLETVQKYPDKLRGLVWTRPTDPKGSPKNVETFLREHGFVGVKFHPEMNQFPADSSCVDGYLDLCEKYQVPAVFHCGAKGSESGPEKIYAAARRYPSVPVVLYHMGFLGPHHDATAAVKEALAKKNADLYLETSQADPVAVLQAVAEVGADRILFGTDATYYGREHYEKYLIMVGQLQQKLQKSDFDKIMQTNATKLFRLPERAALQH